jgi:hypothetical protein
MRMNNSNLGGVTGQGGAAFTDDDVIAVQTGCEFFVPFSELGYNGTSDIKMAGFISDSGRDFVSNQVIGGLPASYNAPGQQLGTSNKVDFSQIPGQHWVTVFQSCPADLNGDGYVDDSDFVIFAANYNNLIAPYRWAPGDFNGDGLVDDTDFVFFASAYNALLCPTY